MVVLVVKRRLAAVFGVCLVLGGVLASAKWISAVPTFSAAVTPPVVLVIDPGHGGEDGGAVQCAQAVLLVHAGAGAWDQAHRTSSVSLKFGSNIRMPAAKRAIP